MGKYQVKKTATGFKFDLKAGNGEVIATSEVYSSEASCLAGINSVRKAAPDAQLEDQTENHVQTATNPKYEVYKDKAGDYRFRLKARNGQNIAASEAYKTKERCMNGVKSVRRNAGDANIDK